MDSRHIDALERRHREQLTALEWVRYRLDTLVTLTAWILVCQIVGVLVVIIAVVRTLVGTY